MVLVTCNVGNRISLPAHRGFCDQRKKASSSQEHLGRANTLALRLGVRRSIFDVILIGDAPCFFIAP